VSDEREQNWYPIGSVGWFTQHIREGIEVTAGQLGVLQPALAQLRRRLRVPLKPWRLPQSRFV